MCSKCSCEESKCKLYKCCNSCTFCIFERATTKERCKSQCKIRKWPNKACERCFFCRSVSFCPSCDKCPQCCRRSACGGPTAKILAGVGPKGFKSKGSIDPERRVQSSIRAKTSSHQGTSDKERICQSPQEQLPAGGIAFPPSETSCRKSTGSVLSGVLQQAFHCPQTKSKMAANLRSQCPQPVQGQNLQNGNPRVHLSFFTIRRVGEVARLQRRLLSHPYQSKLKKVPPVPLSGPHLPVSSSPVWPLYSSYGVHDCGQKGETHGSGKEHPNAPVPGRQADPGKRQRDMFSRYPNPSSLVSGIVLGREPQEIRAGAQTDLQFWGLPIRFDPRRPTPERWEALNSKINSLLERSSCLVRQLMSLIGLLTATEKQVPSGRLHMRPIQWHLKNHWHIPESLEKVIPIPRSLHPHLLWWLKEENILPGQNLHPLRHAVQIFTDASNEGWGAHLGDYNARGGWSVPESRLHINFLELKAVLLALKAFEPLCQGRIALVATDNTTVVAYINKEGGMRSGSLCALLWRLLSWCNLRKICPRACVTFRAGSM